MVYKHLAQEKTSKCIPYWLLGSSKENFKIARFLIVCIFKYNHMLQNLTTIFCFFFLLFKYFKNSLWSLCKQTRLSHGALAIANLVKHARLSFQLVFHCLKILSWWRSIIMTWHLQALNTTFLCIAAFLRFVEGLRILCDTLCTIYSLYPLKLLSHCMTVCQILCMPGVCLLVLFMGTLVIAVLIPLQIDQYDPQHISFNSDSLI